MKRAIIPSIFGWIVGVTFLMVFAYMTRSKSYWTSQPILEFFQGLVLIGIAVGIVVFPTCLLVVTPLLKLLPRTSPLLIPTIAAVIGALAGPFAMYLWAAGFLRRAFVPDFRDSTHLMFAAVSILVGATFAFFYAISIHNSRCA